MSPPFLYRPLEDIDDLFARLEVFPSCVGMEKRIGMLNIHES